jgi:hypothetical protein
MSLLYNNMPTVLHRIALSYLMHCIILLLAHTYLIYPLGHVYTEPKPEVQAEQAHVKEFTNLSLDQGKFWCINQCSLSFTLFQIFLYVPL